MRRFLLLGWMGLATAAFAQTAPSTAAGRLRAEVEERAHTRVSELLRTLCPEQCVLLSTQASVEEESTGLADPGFEPLHPQAKVPVVREVAAHVVLDSALPSAFRTRMKGLLAQKLGGLGGTPKVNVEAVAFPPRNAPHLEVPTPPPAPAPLPAAPPAPVPQVGATSDGPMAHLEPYLPVLALTALLVLAVLGVAALLVLAVRRASAPQDFAYADPGTSLAEAPTGAPQTATPPFPELRERRLVKALVEDRTARNAVVREALSRGELALVARWTRELGDFLLEDLRGEAALSPLGAELSSAAPLDPVARGNDLVELEGRLLAQRLSRSSDAVRGAFGFLEAVRPERFAGALRALSPEAVEVALRFAPSELRQAVLPQLTAEQRTDLALSGVRQREVNTQYALAVADELRAAVDSAWGGGLEATAVLHDVMDSLDRSGQDALLARLARERDGADTGSLVTESTLLSAPSAVLGSAALALPPSALVTYLARSEEDLRERVLGACPPRLQRELREELGVHAGDSEAAYLSARRELLAQVRTLLSRGVRNGAANGTYPVEKPRLVSNVE